MDTVTFALGITMLYSGNEGIGKIIELKLNEKEQKVFDLGIQSVKSAIKRLFTMTSYTLESIKK